jgi:hypothetical protein
LERLLERLGVRKALAVIVRAILRRAVDEHIVRVLCEHIEEEGAVVQGLLDG